MKKSIKILALVLAVLTVVTVLASCGLSGSYKGPTATFKFSGSKITIKGTTGEATGKYKIKDGKITIELDDIEGGLLSGAMKVYNGTFDYEKTDDGIKVGGVEYKKQ